MLLKFISKFISNVRLGFATNSSSSHSLVYYNTPIEDQPGNLPHIGFGWGFFTLTDKLKKLAYGILATHSWWDIDEHDAPEDKRREFILEHYGEILTDMNLTQDDIDHIVEVCILHDSVDHQSRPQLTFMDKLQLREYLESLSDDHLAVHGGNDSGGTHPYNIIEVADFHGINAVYYANNPKEPIYLSDPLDPDTPYDKSIVFGHKDFEPVPGKAEGIFSALFKKHEED